MTTAAEKTIAVRMITSMTESFLTALVKTKILMTSALETIYHLRHLRVVKTMVIPVTLMAVSSMTPTVMTVTVMTLE